MNEPKTKPLYDRIGTNYDTTRTADPYILRRLLHHLQISPTKRYLDIGCGTGNYTCAAAESGGGWVGLDGSERMLRAAIPKSDRVRWLIGNALALPFPDGAFSGAMMTMVLHHMPAIVPALCEIHRVLSEGTLALFTPTEEQTRRFWLYEYFPDALTNTSPMRDDILNALREAGFSSVQTESYEVQEDLRDRFLYSGKHRPELYLDPVFRGGMSAFAKRAHPKEVEEGCRRLSADIASGRIREVRARYENPDGDYLFVVATKTH